MAGKKRVEFSEESGRRIAEAVRKSEHASGPPLPASAGNSVHPQKIFRVKLLGDISDDTPATGKRQIQNEDGEIDWLDIDDAVIGDIYKGDPNQPDYFTNDIVWVTNHRGRWYVLQSAGGGVWLLKNTDDVFLGPVDITGVSSSCEAQKADGAITGVSDTSTIDDVSGVYLGGRLVPPGGFYWARKGDNGWFAVSGGLSLFKGTVNGDGEVLYTPADTDYSEFPVQLTGTVCAEDDFIEDSVVLVGFDGNATYVIRDCCPPDPD